MKNSTRMLTILTLVVAGFFLFGTAVYAGNDDAPKTGFVDANGDGFNDNMKDDDGDGIPNCVDEDYVKSEDGTAKQDGNLYRYNYQTKSQLKYTVMSQWKVFAERQLKVSGDPSLVVDGFKGDLIAEGVHNPAMSDIASKTGIEGAGHNGGK